MAFRAKEALPKIIVSARGSVSEPNSPYVTPVRTSRSVPNTPRTDVDQRVMYHDNGNLQHTEYVNAEGRIQRSPNNLEPSRRDYDEYGNIICEEWFEDGKLHRLGDYPARICYYGQTGRIKSVEYYVNGRLDRFNAPAYITYYPNGALMFKSYYKNGKSHRDGNKPSYTFRSEEGVTTLLEWCKDGKLHRTGGKPARIDKWFGVDDEQYTEIGYYINGQLHSERGNPALITYHNNKVSDKTWYKHGKIHREYEPAKIMYKNGNKVFLKMWYQNGIQHRLDGPATVAYNPDGSVLNEFWFIYGERMEERDAIDLCRLTYTSTLESILYPMRNADLNIASLISNMVV